MPSCNLFLIHGCEKKENETLGNDGGTKIKILKCQYTRTSNGTQQNLLGESDI